MPHDFESVQLGLFTQPNTARTRQERAAPDLGVFE